MADAGNGQDNEDGNEIDNAFADLEAGIIEALDIDMLHQTITFQVRQFWNGEHEEHIAIFEDVASFYMIFGSDTKRFQWLLKRPVTQKQHIGEWTSAGYYPNRVGTVQIHAQPDSWESGWAVRYNTRPNFVVEMGDMMMLIEARLVRINERSFEVGFTDNDGPTEE